MSADKDSGTIEKQILDAIKNIKYGAVELIIHDSRIVQTEKTEKLRFDPARPTQ